MRRNVTLKHLFRNVWCASRIITQVSDRIKMDITRGIYSEKETLLDDV